MGGDDTGLTWVVVVPERQFELAFKMFDTDDNGKLDQREFKQVGGLWCFVLIGLH
jgi:hypothetical protein